MCLIGAFFFVWLKKDPVEKRRRPLSLCVETDQSVLSYVVHTPTPSSHITHSCDHDLPDALAGRPSTVSLTHHTGEDPEGERRHCGARQPVVGQFRTVTESSASGVVSAGGEIIGIKLGLQLWVVCACARGERRETPGGDIGRAAA